MALNWLFGGRERRRQGWLAGHRYVLMRMEVPRNNEKTPLAAEQMFAALHGILQHGSEFQESLSFEIVAQDNAIQFYVYVPAHLKGYVEGQIYAQYPTVEITEVPEYVQFDPSSGQSVLMAELDTTKPEVFPIKSFMNFNVDPLAGITGVLSQAEPNEEVWIQTIIEPVADDWQNRGVSYVSAIKSGVNPNSDLFNIFTKGAMSFATDIVKTAANPAQAVEGKVSNGKTEISGPETTALKAIEEKITKLGFKTRVRILVLAPTEERAKMKLNAVMGTYKQFNTINLNGFTSGKLFQGDQAIELFQTRDMGSGGYVLNIEELASIYHLPSTTVETPTIVWAGSKKGEPPSNLPIIGGADTDEITVFGQTNYRHLTQQFGLKKRDRGLHTYAIGKTGTGKSTMLENMIIDDIRKGRGVAVVDPHGDLIKKVMCFIPNNRVNDVIIFDPSDREFPVAFNPLENVDPDLKNVVSSGVVGIFKKIFGESWGPRLEYILRNTILALLDYPNATMLGITRVLTDNQYRKKVVSKIDDPVIRDFFLNEYERYDQKFRTEAIAPIQNKVGQFLSTSTIRNIVGQPKSTINIREAMDTSKIVLLDLSVGKIGEDNSALLGAMMITKIQLAAMGRASIPESERIDFYLYVDEFQNFATDSFAVILSEARKYHLNLIMTNQYIAQMPEPVSSAVFGNVGTIVSFRVGASDATSLAKEFEPVFLPNDLVNLDNYTIYVKMAIDGVTSTPFSAQTLPPQSNPNDNNDKILAASRERYSRSRGEVEEKIKVWAEFEEPVDGNISRTSQTIAPNVPKSTESVAAPKIIKPLSGINIDGKDIQIAKGESGKKWYVFNEKEPEKPNKRPNNKGSDNNSREDHDNVDAKASNLPANKISNQVRDLQPGETIVLK